MAAASYYSPFIPAFSSNGLPVAGAQLRFRLTGTTTPTPIYTTDALTTEHANPVVANAAARFPDIYLDDSVTYRVDILDADGTQLDSIDPYVPGVTSALITTASGVAVSTRTALAAISAVNGQQASLTESRREGTFIFSTADLSAQVAADTLQGLYVAPSSATTGASGAWVRVRTPGVVHVDWFGTAADGTTDDTAAILAAIANATSEVRFGTGTYAWANNASGATFTLTGKTLRGEGQDVTILKRIATGAAAQTNVVYTIIAENGAKVLDLTIDGNKVNNGLGTTKRNSAIWARGTDVLVQRVTAKNHTGYHFWINGQALATRRVTFRDCRSINCDVHLEPTWSNDSLYENISVEVGDADIANPIGCEVYGTTTNLTLRSIRMSGALTPLNIGTDFGSMDGITLDDFQGITTNATSALSISGATGTVSNLRINNSTFSATAGGGLGANIARTTDAYAVNCRFLGGSIGLAVAADCSRVKVAASRALGTTLYGVEIATGAVGCAFDGDLNGGSLSFTGPLSVSASSTLTPSGIGLPILQQKYGQGTLVSAGGNDSYIQIAVPTNITNSAKVHVTATVRGTDASSVAPTKAAYWVEWSYTNAASLNLKIVGDGSSLSGSIVSYHFVEWA